MYVLVFEDRRLKRFSEALVANHGRIFLVRITFFMHRIR